MDADRRVVHGSLVETVRVEAGTPAVFAAFADPPVRARWFRLPAAPETTRHELDFRQGGSELLAGTVTVTGTPERVEYRARFLDIVADRRVVFSTEVLIDGRRRSVSLVTAELNPDPAGGTLVTWTEQYAFLDVDGDGTAETAEREGGTRLLLNRLRAVTATLV